MTATFGSIAAATYSNHQACLKEADEKARLITKLELEIKGRQSDIFAALSRSKGLDDFNERVKNIVSHRPEFKDIPLRFLIPERDNLFTYIIQRYEMRSVTIPDPIERKFFDILYGESMDVVEQADYATFVEQQGKLRASLMIKNSPHYVSYVPYCTITGSLASLWTRRRYIIDMELH